MNNTLHAFSPKKQSKAKKCRWLSLLCARDPRSGTRRVQGRTHTKDSFNSLTPPDTPKPGSFDPIFCNRWPSTSSSIDRCVLTFSAAPQFPDEPRTPRESYLCLYLVSAADALPSVSNFKHRLTATARTATASHDETTNSLPPSTSFLWRLRARAFTTVRGERERAGGGMGTGAGTEVKLIVSRAIVVPREGIGMLGNLKLAKTVSKQLNHKNGLICGSVCNGRCICHM